MKSGLATAGPFEKVRFDMSEYTITIRVEIPEGTPYDKFVEWAKYVTGYSCFLPASNPLANMDLQATNVTIRAF